MSEHVLVCANHPGRETTLRCSRCEKPICSQCAVLTPVGYRCKECVRERQAVFETAHRTDFILAAVVAGVGTGIAIALLRFLGYWGVIVAPVVGGGLAEIVRWAVRRRRARRLPMAAAIGAALGVLPHLLLPLSTLVFAVLGGEGRVALSAVWAGLWPLVYGVLIVSALFYRLRGIRV